MRSGHDLRVRPKIGMKPTIPQMIVIVVFGSLMAVAILSAIDSRYPPAREKMMERCEPYFQYIEKGNKDE